MGDSEAVQSLENYIEYGDTLIAKEKHEVMDPFLFMFEHYEDMQLFFWKTFFWKIILQLKSIVDCFYRNVFNTIL